MESQSNLPAQQGLHDDEDLWRRRTRVHVRDGTFSLLDGEEPKGLDKALHQQTHRKKGTQARAGMWKESEDLPCWPGL